MLHIRISALDRLERKDVALFVRATVAALIATAIFVLLFPPLH